MNLLVNAAHAIEKQGGRSRPLDVGSRVPARFKCKRYEDIDNCGWQRYERRHNGCKRRYQRLTVMVSHIPRAANMEFAAQAEMTGGSTPACPKERRVELMMK
jgi:hypothetical protein